jgi:hypothetical protein
MTRPLLFAALSVGAAALLGLAVHLWLGWQWVLGAAVVAGAVAPRQVGVWGAALLAALGVALEWGGLIAWNHLRFAEPASRMTEAMGTILGGLPPTAVPGLSLVIGVVLGLLGGAIGMGLKKAVRPAPPPESLPSGSRLASTPDASSPLPKSSA